jgi:hypothetical protein
MTTFDETVIFHTYSRTSAHHRARPQRGREKYAIEDFEPITEPSTGRVTINGRVASLLEVGTGFHPELSGRGNVYLNVAEQMKIAEDKLDMAIIMAIMLPKII